MLDESLQNTVRGESAPAPVAAADATAEINETAGARTGRKPPRLAVPMSERAGFTPSEFAALFGKSPTWGYRAIYAQRVKVIYVGGTMLIPASEVTRIQAGAQPLESRRRKRRSADSNSAGSEQR